MEKKFRYLVPGDYMADPAVHVFDGKLYIYPSHDRESGVEENDNCLLYTSRKSVNCVLLILLISLPRIALI